MKLFKKLLSVVAVCVCCIALAASAGCQTYNDVGKCEGIVKSYTVDDIYVKVLISEEHEGLYFYPTLLIYQSTLKTYNCSSISELLDNEDYVANRKSDYTLTAYENEYLLPEIFLNIDGDKLIYLLIYAGTEINLDDGMPDSFFIISNPTNYIGSIKFN